MIPAKLSEQELDQLREAAATHRTAPSVMWLADLRLRYLEARYAEAVRLLDMTAHELSAHAGDDEVVEEVRAFLSTEAMAV